jgi:serine/threonine protein kinase
MEAYMSMGVLGGGAFGEVYMAKRHDSNDERQFAVKTISKTKEQKANIRREVEAGHRLSHPYIVNFVEHREDNNYDYLVSFEIYWRLQTKFLWSDHYVSMSTKKVRDCDGYSLTSCEIRSSIAD